MMVLLESQRNRKQREDLGRGFSQMSQVRGGSKPEGSNLFMKELQKHISYNKDDTACQL